MDTKENGNEGGKELHRNGRARVIVIGGGVAGMTAASELASAGLSVVLLEAETRLGGRIYSRIVKTPAGSRMIDLGAMWLHGDERCNPLSKLARAKKTPIVVCPFSETSFFKEGEGWVEKKVQDSMWKEYTRTMIAYSKIWQEQGSRQMTLKWGLDQTWKDASLTSKRNPAFSRSWFDYLIQTEVEQEYSGLTSEMSNWWWDSDKEIVGRDYFVPSGLMPLFVASLSDFDRVDAQLDTEVKSIDRSGSGIVVNTSKGTKLEADMVVVTVSVGVLKSNCITFLPSLSESFSRALNYVKLGQMNDTYVVLFPFVFWHVAAETINFMPAVGSSAFPVAFNGAFWLNGAPILVFFSSVSTKGQSDDWARTQIMNQLHTMYGSDIPDPIDFIAERWTENPHFLGAYSFRSSGITNVKQNTLMLQKDGNRTVFAGEHTDLEYPATIIGAIASGKRAAKQVIQTLENKN